MKKFALILFMGMSVAAAIAQRPTNPTPPATTPAGGIQGNPPATPPTGPRTGPRPYKEIITDKAVSQRGLFTVHQVDDKFYFEIPNNVLNREIMAVTRFVRVPSSGTYGGQLTNQQTVLFERGPNKNIFMRVVTLVNIADSTNAISRAVNNSNLNAIAAAFPIAAYGRDSASYVVEVTEYFKGDNQVVSISPQAKRAFNLGSLAADRSYIQQISTFPTNTEVRTVKTFNSTPAAPGGGGAPSPTPGSAVPAANAAGAVTIELNTSMILLPAKPMAIRYWDRRVGYFPENYTAYSDVQQRVDETMIAVRWRLEPKDEDVERWKRGELVEPKKPIIYYIDPATPAQWRPYLIAGINDWQSAFEAAGFKNAIIGKEWPANDPTMSMEDARFSVIRYFASDVANASGPNVHDPRSGEILESHIQWYHNVMSLVHDWYMVQAAATDPNARKMKFDDALMGELIRFVSSHEVGHTLGLMHNMGSSSKTPVENLRNKEWIEANGHTASIMDYARFNYVAQPQDNISAKGLFPRIGEYDKWAIKWGYGYIPGTTEEEQKKASNKLIVETLSKNPRTYFGTYELGNSDDPRNQSEDLGDNAMKASEYGIKNLKYILNNLSDWTKDETDLNQNINIMYSSLTGQFRRYMGHVTSNIGGVYETFKTSAQAESVYEPTPKAKQKEAMSFLHNQLFETPSWLVNKQILNRINRPGATDAVSSAQEGTINSLVSASRLNRMQAATERFGADKAYGALEMLSDLQSGLFSELSTKKATDNYRRSLQKSYVDKLNNVLNPPAAIAVTAGGFGGQGGGATVNVSRSDAPSIARAQLMALRAQLAAAIPTTTDRMTKIHLIDLQERVKDALDPKS